MSWDPFSTLKRPPIKHIVFISFHHKDWMWKIRFEAMFGHLFINRSIKLGGIASDISDQYIKRLIQEGHIMGSSVLVVLVGPETYCRKHVDWEIAAALSKKVGSYSGLVGILLPNHPDYLKPSYDSNIVPPRLVDNLQSEYAKLYDWTNDKNLLAEWIELAFKSRVSDADKIQNWRLQFKHNRCG